MYVCRFEVGIRVEGYAVGEEKRHINSAFYIFRAMDENVVLPKLVADSEVGMYVWVLYHSFMVYQKRKSPSHGLPLGRGKKPSHGLFGERGKKTTWDAFFPLHKESSFPLSVNFFFLLPKETCEGFFSLSQMRLSFV